MKKKLTDKQALEKVVSLLRADGYEADVDNIKNEPIVGLGLYLSPISAKKKRADVYCVFRFDHGRVIVSARGGDGTALPQDKWTQAGMLCDLGNSHLLIPFLRVSRPDGHVEAVCDIPYVLLDYADEFELYWKGAVQMFTKYGIAVNKSVTVDMEKIKRAISSALGLDDDDEDDEEEPKAEDKDDDEEEKPKRRPGRPRGSRNKRH